MGFFDGIDKVKASFDSNYMAPGQYWCRVDRMKQDKNRAGIENLVVEMQIVRVVDGKDTANRAGEDVSVIHSSNKDGYLSRTKAMFANLMGVEANEITPDVCIKACGTEQPLAGMICEIHVVAGPNKKGAIINKQAFKREVPDEEVRAWLATPEGGIALNKVRGLAAVASNK